MNIIADMKHVHSHSSRLLTAAFEMVGFACESLGIPRDPPYEQG